MQPETSIAHLVQLVEAAAPSVGLKREGASIAEVGDYQACVGVPLPSAIVDFHLFFGLNNGGFKLFPEATTNTRDLIRFYREDYQKEIDIPEGYVVLATGGLSIPEVCIDLGGTPPHRVVVVADGVGGYCFGESFENVAFQVAFQQFRLSLPPFQSFLWGAPSVFLLDRVITMLERLGFSRLDYSDSLNYCAEMPDAVVYCRQASEPLVLRLSSFQQSFANRVTQELIETFGLRGGRK